MTVLASAFSNVAANVITCFRDFSATEWRQTGAATARNEREVKSSEWPVNPPSVQADKKILCQISGGQRSMLELANRSYKEIGDIQRRYIFVINGWTYPSV